MQLLIVRHAIACARDSRRWTDDRERPLSPVGARRARLAACGLARIAPRPDCVLTSPLRRARQTADILSRAAGWPAARVGAALAPGRPPAAVLAVLASQRESCIAIVGHEPGLGQLLAAGLGQAGAPPAFELKKPACACLTFPGRVSAGRARLQWLAPPRLLRALR